MATLTTRL